VKAETSKPKAAAKAAPTAAKTAAAPAATKVAAKATAKATPKVAPPAVADVPAQPLQAGSQVPVRSTRPSSRLAQLTVPSMAQAVASTAAKASYLHTMPTTAQVHPTYTAAKKDPKLANNWKTKSAEELTDAEVMAMPDSEYMNDKQMAFFRLKLVHLKQDIHNSAGETTEHLREDTVVVPDPPTAPPSKKSTHWNCAPATANASCSRRSSNPLAASIRATMVIATKPANPSAWAA
jgi:DnaK suppressor protein